MTDHGRQEKEQDRIRSRLFGKGATWRQSNDGTYRLDGTLYQEEISSNQTALAFNTLKVEQKLVGVTLDRKTGNVTCLEESFIPSIVDKFPTGEKESQATKALFNRILRMFFGPEAVWKSEGDVYVLDKKLPEAEWIPEGWREPVMANLLAAVFNKFLFQHSTFDQTIGRVTISKRELEEKWRSDRFKSELKALGHKNPAALPSWMDTGLAVTTRTSGSVNSSQQPLLNPKGSPPPADGIPATHVSEAHSIEHTEMVKHELFKNGRSGWEEDKENRRYVLRDGLPMAVTSNGLGKFPANITYRKRMRNAFNALMANLLETPDLKNAAELEDIIRDPTSRIKSGDHFFRVSIDARLFEEKIKPKLNEYDGGELATNVRDFMVHLPTTPSGPPRTPSRG